MVQKYFVNLEDGMIEIIPPLLLLIKITSCEGV